ncbi:hypothetical protein [Candidatus Amarobacter glycogenicus]|uniref:hypothetical protein n=1 Tax=Candidatus Amarobacter glycogenicus TaxID=3140699 RepID=UPI0031364630|nr:hypothetical protein [Dehalococcoidia bacterium]
MLKESGNAKEAEALEQRAADLGNQAMLQNAFGEHYLQDAYAGGHLVNKTKIMQWFVQWLASNGGLGSTDLGEAQFAMAKHAASQDLASNPQRLDDRIKRGEMGSMQEASSEVGMGNKPEIVFMMKWRRAAAGDDSMQDLTPKAAQEAGLADRDTARTHMRALVSAGFAERQFDEVTGERYFHLNEKMVDTAKGATFAPYQATQSEKGAPDFEEEAAEFNLASYNQFLSNAYIQGATKFFHDKYCKEGLNVVAANGDAIYTVYGDNNMLKAGGQGRYLRRDHIAVVSRGDLRNPGGQGGEGALPGRDPGEVPGARGRSGRSGNLARRLEQAAPSARHQRALRRSAATAPKVLSKAKPSGSISGGHAIDIQALASQIEKAPEHDEGTF